MSLIKFFRVDLLITFLALVVAYFYAGWAAVPLTFMLILLEMVFSFDNAAVNAKYVEKLNHRWRMIFLTVGILIAVVGMRLIFPFLIVFVTAGLDPISAWSLAMEKGDPNTPGTYGFILDQAHPQIVGFGGMFLLMLFLSFMFDTEREVTWLSWVEKPMQKLGEISSMPAAVSLLILLGAAEFLVDDGHKLAVLMAGILGILLYLVVDGLSGFMESQQEKKDAELEAQGIGKTLLLGGKAAFSVFLFLEVLDASFSFDGVLGAFAITSDPIIIALGLGVGALYVRSMTIYLVEKGTLAEYRFLEHGAHWAIGALAIVLIFTLKFHVHELITGGIGILFIAIAVWASVRAKKRDIANGTLEKDDELVSSETPDTDHTPPTITNIN